MRTFLRLTPQDLTRFEGDFGPNRKVMEADNAKTESAERYSSRYALEGCCSWFMVVAE